MNLFEKASWIWLNEYDKVNVYVAFHDKIKVENKRGAYTFRISVDTNYALYINGDMVESGQYADYPFDKVYDELDITPYIVEGDNIIRIDCWHQGNDSSTIRGEKAGLIYTLTNGDDLLLASSEAAYAAAIEAYDTGVGVEYVSGQLGYSFHYDSRREDKTPIPAVAVDKPLPIRKRPIKKLIIGKNEPAVLTVRGSFTETSGGTVGQRMQYAALSFIEPNVSQRLPDANGITLNGDGGVFAVIDTGKENAGILSLDLDLPCDAEILIGWGEHLEDMRVRAYVGGRNFAASYYGKAGRNTFIHPFRRLGMRYLELHIYARSATVRYAGIKTTDYPVTDNIAFTCADSLHKNIYDVCKRTLLMCMHEHYEDCPWREQALYSMDSRNQMLCGYYTFREFDFAKASLRLMAQSIRDDNMLELCSPARVAITIPSFSAIFMTQVFEYVLYSGDIDFAREIMPAVQRVADEFIRRIDPEIGLIPCFKEAQYWNFYEWQEGLAGSISGSIANDDVTYDAPLNAFVAFGLFSCVRMLEMLNEYCYDGDNEYNPDIQRYDDAFCTLIKATDKHFWNPEKGVYASYINKNGEMYHYCELTNSLILYANIFDSNELQNGRSGRVREALASETLIPVTISHSIFKYDVLLGQTCSRMTLPHVNDKNTKYARYVFADIAKKWGYMLSKDATTFWETIDGAPAFGNAGSLCHGWAAIPAYFYHRFALNLSSDITGLYECKASN